MSATATVLTPYDTGTRLEPRPWHVQPRNLAQDAAEAARYGKVDFDNEESATVLTAHVERTENKGYVVNAYVHGETDVTVELTRDDQEVLLLQPSAALQEKVQAVIDELPTETERIESSVYWQQGQALILVGGETGYRKQQAIIVYEPGYAYGDTMSAKVGNWAGGVRDTRIG